MSNYIKTTDFAAKDALASGNPNKIASGTQVDAEFNNIATAIATKEDTSDKAAANGYASLDANAVVPDAQISESSVTQHEAALTILETQITNGSLLARVASTETISAVWNFTSAPTISGGTIMHSGNDGTGSGFDADLLDGNHAAAFATASHAHATSDITSGTLADARVAASNVTQHAFALILAAATIESDPGTTPTGSPGQLFFYY